jgi:hypothetical protein
MTRRTGRRPASSINRPGRSRRPPVGRPFLVKASRDAVTRIRPADLGLQMRHKPMRRIHRRPGNQSDPGPHARHRDDDAPGRR